MSGGAHLSRKEDSRARASATRSSTPQKNYFFPVARDSHSPYPKSDNSPRAHAEPANNSRKSRPARKCYACGGIGHIARVCPRTAQSAANASSFTSGAVASSCGSVGQLFAEAVIGKVRVAEALVDTGSALSMLSTALYARLHDAPAIQPFPRDAL